MSTYAIVYSLVELSRQMMVIVTWIGMDCTQRALTRYDIVVFFLNQVLYRHVTPDRSRLCLLASDVLVASDTCVKAVCQFVTT